MHAQATETYPATVEAQLSGVSWAAIIAGGVGASALSLLLLALGAGLGFSAVSPWSNSGVSATTFSIGAGLYLIVMAMVASTIGGYLAGRLRTKWVGVHTHEVFFRDTAHGFLAWAFATVLSAAVLASAASHIVGAGAAGLGQPTGVATANQSAGDGVPMDNFVDRLFRSDPAANRPPLDPAARSEIARLFTATVRNGGEVSAPDRTYVAQVVAARTGLGQQEAEQRVAEVISQAKTALDNARKAAAHLSLWLTASLLIGAFCASLAATEGGQLRDGTLTYDRGLKLRSAI
jgi:hypothetical protein